MREVTLTPTHTNRGIEENPPVYIYDTSGPYTDPKVRIDLMAGLADIRTPWIEARGDTQTLSRPQLRLRPPPPVRPGAGQPAL